MLGGDQDREAVGADRGHGPAGDTIAARPDLFDHARGWVQQYHVGAMRNNNARMRKLLGPDSGFDSIGDFEQGRGIARFLDRLDETDQLAKTILYNLNPADNELMATMIGNFQDGSVPGKMQCGSAGGSWTNSDGMRRIR
jgi:glucuronate isomerase